MKCKKCSTILTGKQTSYCSRNCSKLHLKSLWQKRKRIDVNATRKKWRDKTDRHSDRKWYAKNIEKVLAHRKVQYAVSTSAIEKLPCQICGNIKSNAHHEDYSKPLEIIWLCATHHREIHDK